MNGTMTNLVVDYDQLILEGKSTIDCCDVEILL
jgi:hypothetical protein